MRKLTVEKQAIKIVKRIIGGKYDVEVFNELYMIEDQIRRGIYATEELEKYTPLFCEYVLGEQRKLLLLISEELLKEIRNKDNTYLKNLRIIEALSAIKTIDKVKKVNNKIKFCLEFHCLAQSGYSMMGTQFKTIALLDRE